MDRSASHSQDQVNILVHIVLYDLHRMFVCMKLLRVQHQNLAAFSHREPFLLLIDGEAARNLLFQFMKEEL